MTPMEHPTDVTGEFSTYSGVVQDSTFRGVVGSFGARLQED